MPATIMGFDLLELSKIEHVIPGLCSLTPLELLIDLLGVPRLAELLAHAK